MPGVDEAELASQAPRTNPGAASARRVPQSGGRRPRFACLWLALLACNPLAERAPAPGGGAPPAAPSLERPAVRALRLTVSDLERSVALFRALDFELVEQRALSGAALEALVGIEPAELRVAVLRLGTERVELDQFISGVGRPIPAAAAANDLVFQHMAIVVRDMDSAFLR